MALSGFPYAFLSLVMALNFSYILLLDTTRSLTNCNTMPSLADRLAVLLGQLFVSACTTVNQLFGARKLLS